MKTIRYDKTNLKAILERGGSTISSVNETVAAILDDIRTNGDSALKQYSLKFDGFSPDDFFVSESEFEAAFCEVDDYLQETFRIAIDSLTVYHKQQIRQGYEITPDDGVVLGQRVLPMERAGLYIPGGTASYPSTVLMNAVPAKLAGVKEIVMATPPNKSGRISAPILVAARMAGVDRVIKAGGAQAIAALAYGTESIPKVDKIVGPGNIFVATAKRMVSGVVSIDMFAGPSEVMIIADGNANAAYVAADLLAQAEHDKLSSAVLLTTDEQLAQNVSAEVERQLAELPRRDIATASIDANGKIVIVDSIIQAIDIANAYAPEHLEICVENAIEYLPQVVNAGAVFLGNYTPEALGDYMAGTNHVLPTSGTARFSSPLSVDDFVKKTSYLSYSKAALQTKIARIADFAEREGLSAHARSVLIRGDK